MDTSKFTSDKEAGDGYRDYRKACQTAFDDINAVLDPKPKINKIMATNVMGQAIIDKIGACVGVDAEDNPIWTDQRAANLKPETIELYSFLVSPEGMAQMGMAAPEPAEEPDPSAVVQQTPEVAAAEAAGLPDPALAQGPKFVAEGQECLGWINKTGPDPRYKETCDACSRNEACAAQVVVKAATKEKAPKEPKSPKEPKAPSAADFLAKIFCDAYFVDANPTDDDVQQALVNKGLSASPSLIGAWRRDINRTMNYLKSAGKLK